MTALSTYAKPEHIMAEFARCWIYMGVLWLTWVYDPEQHPNGCVAVQFQPEFKSCLSRAETDVLWWVLVMLIGTLLIHVLVNVLYPAAVDNAFWGKGITWFWRLREVEEEPGVFTYRPEGWFSCRRMRIQYTGEVDVSTGLPDGAGAWVADTYHGEAMRGYWDQGVPVAPAFARQVGTSAVFVKLCIGIVSNRGEDLVKELRAFHWKPRARGTMQYGEAHVETSITGGYFPFLPYCERVTCFDSLNGLAPRVKVNVTRLHSLLGAPKAELREALIFVHGFNCPIAHAAERFAQLLALGRMPGHIAPFVYSWAAGRDVAYFQVRKSIPQGVGGLSEMVRGLAEQGFSTVHLLVHSLGAQVVLHEIPLLEKVVSPVGSPLKGRPSLATLTFMNADAPRERFLDLVPRMLGIAERLTGYNDHTDGALFWSELVNGKPFSKAFTFGTLVDSWHTGPDRPRYMAHKGAELEPASNDHLGLARRFDIIDCGSMDQNVYNMRHSYFCLNATLVADLTELIGRCRGADQRDRLIRVETEGTSFRSCAYPGSSGSSECIRGQQVLLPSRCVCTPEKPGAGCDVGGRPISGLWCLGGAACGAIFEWLRHQANNLGAAGSAAVPLRLYAGEAGAGCVVGTANFPARRANSAATDSLDSGGRLTRGRLSVGVGCAHLRRSVRGNALGWAPSGAVSRS
eukprot:CAMPEP_0204381806 /NCGR_PEP_ID=MMETSP0469-20131031/54559_1 /ASSEMBLY_ACC=CAM_ASM_000384 /TAXON_ID=2969 /ORGANISM="Oxyrrhis marina" /LENGTH=684 /DNA_ID=CAMNT_0051373725 /DNA_START=227 /DNA_END=2280 /DNA_ORIENTATION=-